MTKLLKTLLLSTVLLTTGVLAYEKGSVNPKAYPNGDVLITAEEAIKLIGKKGVMFVSGDSHDIYNNQHIKGSVEMYAHHLHHSDIMGNMHCAPLYQCIEEAEELIGKKGIDNDTLVIAYDDYRGPNATGVYSFFKSFGHEKVKVLMGGFKAIAELDPAQAEFDKITNQIKDFEEPIKLAQKIERYKGYVAKFKEEGDAKKAATFQKKLEREEAKAKKEYNGDLKAAIAKANDDIKKAEARLAQVKEDLLVVGGHEHVEAKTYKIDPKKINKTAIAGKEDVLKAVKDIQAKGENSKYVIVDARGMIEIIGERRMDNVARGGHVPGATFLEWKHISDNERGVAFKEAKEIAKTFEKYGISKDKTIYAYCQVGAGRGSHIITALEILGYKNAKVYTGSWDEWGNDMMLPIKR